MVTLNDLTQIVSAIADVDIKEPLLENGGTRSMHLRQYQAIVARFESRRKSYVDGLLEDDEDRHFVVERVRQELAQINDPKIESSVRYLTDNLIPYLQKEAIKPPWFRKALRLLDRAFLILSGAVVASTILYIVFSRLKSLL